MSKIDLQALRGNQNEAFLEAAKERHCANEATYLLTHRRPAGKENHDNWPELGDTIRPLNKARIEAFCSDFANSRAETMIGEGDKKVPLSQILKQDLTQAFDIAIQSEPGIAVAAKPSGTARGA